MSWSLKNLIVFEIQEADFYLLQTWLAQTGPDIWTQLEEFKLQPLPQHLAVIQVDHLRRTVWCVASYASVGYPPEAEQQLSDFWASAGAGVPNPVTGDQVHMLSLGSGTYTFAVASLNEDRGHGGIRVITR